MLYKPSARSEFFRAAKNRSIGDERLRSGRAALLRVPSVIAPATWNIPINPQRPESGQIRVVREHRHGLDARLAR